MSSFVFSSPVGFLEIVSTDEFITQINFLDTNVSSPKDEGEMPEVLAQCIFELTEYFAGKRNEFTVAIKSEGTPFQQNVWKALMQIPYGQTLSYGELSKRLNNEKAVRAVGTANGSNPLPIIIPCHRVIGSNGKLIGYGGGLERKKWLLTHEMNFSKRKDLLF